jgi:hypothetical protein
MPRLDPNIWPPGGWRYTQPDTGFVFSSDTLHGLAVKVVQHRRANNLDAGDPEAQFKLVSQVLR